MHTISRKSPAASGGPGGSKPPATSRGLGRLPGALRASLLLGLVAIAGHAVTAQAASAPPGGGTGTLSPCAQPVTVGLCESDAYRAQCNADAVCAPLLTAAWKKVHQQSIAVDPSVANDVYYLDEDARTPAVPAQRAPFKISGAKILKSGGTSYPSLEAAALAAAQAKEVANPASYVRDPAVLANGMASCAEFTYEKYYDYMRFVDAANACKNDGECVYQMAYHAGAPGIAQRTLRQKYDGKAIGLPVPLEDAVLPKNSFYAASMFLPPSLGTVFPSHAAALDALRQRMYRQSEYYGYGSYDSSQHPVKKFADEWAFHKSLHDATAGVAPADFKIYDKRRAKFEHVLFDFDAYLTCKDYHPLDVTACEGAPVAIGNPSILDMVSLGDPFERSVLLTSMETTTQAVRLLQAGQTFRLSDTGRALLPRASTTPITIGGIGGIGGIGSIGTVGTVGTLGIQALAAPAPAPTPMKAMMATSSSSSSGTTLATMPSAVVLAVAGTDPTLAQYAQSYTIAGRINAIFAADPPPVDPTVSYPRFDCDADAAAHPDDEFRIRACRVTNGLLEEYSRMLPGAQGSKSCLDPTSQACDWSPSMFAERFAHGDFWMDERSRDFNRCMRWTRNNFGAIPATDTVQNGVHTGGKDTVTNVETYMTRREEALKNFKVPSKTVYPTPGHPETQFGDGTTEFQEIGDKDTVGGGYSWDVHWTSNILTRKPSQTANVPGDVCRMDFEAAASFQAWAYVFGGKHSLVDAVAQIQANKQDDAKAGLRKYINIAGYTVPGFEDESIKYYDINQSIPLVMWNNREDITLLSVDIPLPMGFIATISGGIELSYGIQSMANFGITPPPTCMDEKALQASITFMPYAGAGVWAKAEGSWLHLVGGGIEVEVDLIRASIPVKATASVGFDPADGVVNLGFDLTGQLQLETLHGHVDACGHVLIFGGCATITEWPGKKFPPINLFQPVHAKAQLDLF